MHKATPVVIAVVLVLALFVGVNAQAVATNFNWVVTKLLTVTDTATFTSGVNVAGALTAASTVDAGATTVDSLIVDGAANFTGRIVAADYFATTDWMYFIPPAALTVTDGAVITPTATVMELTAAGAVGAELINAGDGQLLILVNTGAQTITISDTATIESTGDIALGAADTLTLIGVGVKWYELASSNN